MAFTRYHSSQHLAKVSKRRVRSAVLGATPLFTKIRTLAAVACIALLSGCGSGPSEGVIRLIDHFEQDMVRDAPTKIAPAETVSSWKFGEIEEGSPAMLGWKAGVGVSGLEVSKGRLRGHSTTDSPIIYVEIEDPVDTTDLLHAVEVRRSHMYGFGMPILDDEGEVLPYLFEARDRGVKFDVGHGRGSFLWGQVVPAIRQGWMPDSISTDLHTRSMNRGMKDMLNVMSKFLNQGVSLRDVIQMSTLNPAAQIKRDDLGHLGVGAGADVAVIRVEHGRFGFLDVRNKRVILKTAVGRLRTAPTL